MNEIILSGEIKRINFSHEVLGEKFYEIGISTLRTSGVADTLQIIASEVFAKTLEEGRCIKVIGEIRTRNVPKEGKIHLEVFVFANEIKDYDEVDENKVFIDGYICKSANVRSTPKGRQVADTVIATNRRNMKSSYIPCIAWSRNAIKVSNYEVGTHLRLSGRLQSREYTKKYDDGTEEIKTAYEVSINAIEEVDENEN